MRKNTTVAFAAWEACKTANPSQAIRSDGVSIWSYATCLVAYDAQTDGVILNVTKYSQTTTQQQNGLRLLLQRSGYGIIEVDGLDRGVTPEDLRRAARPLFEVVAEYVITADEIEADYADHRLGYPA
jgi:hypothetical protein